MAGKKKTSQVKNSLREEFVKDKLDEILSLKKIFLQLVTSLQVLEELLTNDRLDNVDTFSNKNYIMKETFADQPSFS